MNIKEECTLIIKNQVGKPLLLKKSKVKQIVFKAKTRAGLDNWEKAHIFFAPPNEINLRVARLFKITCKTANNMTRRERLCWRGVIVAVNRVNLINW